MMREEKTYPEEWITISTLNQETAQAFKIEISMDDIESARKAGKSKQFLLDTLIEVFGHMKNKPKHKVVL